MDSPVHRAVFSDLGDTLTYLWAPKEDRLLFLCERAGLGPPSDAARQRSRVAFLQALGVEEPGPVAGSLGWRGSLGAYHAGLVAMGVEDAETRAGRLYDVARELPFEITADSAAEGLLRRLRLAGVRLGVISNHVGTLRENLEELGLLEFFDVTIDSRLVGLRKPDPEIFRMACRRVGVSPEEAAHVGDEPRSDVDGALAAGLRPILLDPLGVHAPVREGVVVAPSLAHLSGMLLPQ